MGNIIDRHQQQLPDAPKRGVRRQQVKIVLTVAASLCARLRVQGWVLQSDANGTIGMLIKLGILYLGMYCRSCDAVADPSGWRLARGLARGVLLRQPVLTGWRVTYEASGHAFACDITTLVLLWYILLGVPC